MSDYDHALKDANLEWNNVLMKLWTAFGKQFDLKQFKVYRDILGNVPIGVLEHVVEETIKQHNYNNVPTLAEVNRVLKELHPDYDDPDNEVYVKTRPQRVAADLRREKGINYPRPITDFKAWVGT